MITIIIEGELPDLNTDIGLIRSHYMAYSNHKKEWTTNCQMQILSQVNRYKLEIEPNDYPLIPVFFWTTKNSKKDCDNVTFAKKYIFDGMKLTKLITDDSRRYIAGFGGDFFRVADKAKRGYGDGVKIILLTVNEYPKFMAEFFSNKYIDGFANYS